MHRHGRALYIQLRGVQLFTVGQLRSRHDLTRSLTSSETGSGATAWTGLTSTSVCKATLLDSVVSVREGPNTFASATVAFREAANGSPEACEPSAVNAAKVALLALRGALGSERAPSVLVALASLELPPLAVQQLAAALAAELGQQTPVVGCSSRLRVPDERRAAGAAAGASPTASERSSPWTMAAFTSRHGGALMPAAAETEAAVASGPLFHITLAAAHLPNHEVHAVRSETSSLPRLPYLAESLQGRRPPVFLLLSGSDSVSSELLSRLENLFPGSCIGGGVAAQPPSRDRRGVVLVGPGEAGGGSTRATSEGADDLGSPAASVAGGSGGGGGSGGPASDLEGPFQRMLLDREGSGLQLGGNSSGVGASDGIAPASATAASPTASPATTEGPERANGSSKPVISSSTTTSSCKTVGRRRRSPTTTSAPSEPPAPTWAPGTAAADGPTDLASTLSNISQSVRAPASTTSAATATASAGPPASAPVGAAAVPPLVFSGDRIHSGGAMLLALYPRTDAASAGLGPGLERIGAAEGMSARSPGGGRLSAAACDRLARVVLGTDHLQYVSLKGAALSAISPPATGSELIAASPPAPDNPCYWWPATAALPRLVLDPHVDSNSKMGATSDVITNRARHEAEHDPANPAGFGLDPARNDAEVGAAGSATRQQAHRAIGATEGSQGAAAAAAPGEQRDAAEQATGADAEAGPVDEADGGSPSAAALAALSEGLVGLPLFPLEGTFLFPGQTIQMRIFEKRYRLLMRSCLEQGAAFGLCAQGMGSTAVVRGYQRPENDSADVLVLLEGGMRFSYREADLDVLPASYGINVAERAEYVVDDPPASEADCAAMIEAAHSIIDGIAGALEAATAPPARNAARTFANALHFASSQQPPQPQKPEHITASDTDTGTAVSPVVEASSGPAAPTPTPTTAPNATAAAAGADPAVPNSSADDSNSESDAALLASDLAEAKRALDADTASLLSLYLAPHIPVHLESLRRQWFTSRSAVWRLQQEAAWLKSNHRVCMAVASSVLRLPREHLLRVMLGLSRVASAV